jgi:pimeloyl-ACP methyl ester carboxylesterase
VILTQRLSAEAAPLAVGSVKLSDGRALGWTAWGAEGGATVIGQPHFGVTGRRALAIDIDAFAQAGIRVVFVCRAGMGPSDRHEGRTADNDAEDMLALVDALEIDRADLLGECGGTGAVVSLAARRPDRVRGIALVSAMAPLAGPRRGSLRQRPPPPDAAPVALRTDRPLVCA